MRITFHIGEFTITIIVYREKTLNRHLGKGDGSIFELT